MFSPFFNTEISSANSVNTVLRFNATADSFCLARARQRSHVTFTAYSNNYGDFENEIHAALRKK